MASAINMLNWEKSTVVIYFISNTFCNDLFFRTCIITLSYENTVILVRRFHTNIFHTIKVQKLLSVDYDKSKQKKLYVSEG